MRLQLLAADLKPSGVCSRGMPEANAFSVYHHESAVAIHPRLAQLVDGIQPLGVESTLLGGLK